MDELVAAFRLDLSSGALPAQALHNLSVNAGKGFGTMTVIHTLRSFGVPFDVIREIQHWHKLVGPNGISDQEVNRELMKYLS